jgi:hypothetical protein
LKVDNVTPTTFHLHTKQILLLNFVGHLGRLAPHRVVEGVEAMRKGSMALIGKIFRKNDASWLVVHEAAEEGKLVVRKIDGHRETHYMAVAEVAASLHRQYA